MGIHLRSENKLSKEKAWDFVRMSNRLGCWERGIGETKQEVWAAAEHGQDNKMSGTKRRTLCRADQNRSG